MQAVSETLVVTGNAEAVNAVKLVARVPGYLEKIHFEDGQLVKKGDLLFTVQQDQYKDQLQQAEAQLQAAIVARDHAHLEVGRYTALLKQHATSQVDVDHWVFEEKTAEANILAAEAQVALAKLNLSYTLVTAPFDGQMGKHLIDPNNLVGGGGQQAALAEITQLDPIYVVANISSQQALQIRANSTSAACRSTICTRSRSRRHSPTRPTFRIAARSSTSRRRSTRRPARFTCAGSCATPTGRCCRACSSTSACRWARSPRARCSFPQIALQEDQGGRYLFVVDDNDVVQKRYVQLGEAVGDWQVATSGVARSDRIVVGELWRVSPGVTVTPKATTLDAVQ